MEEEYSDESYTPLTREQQHRLSKMNATKTLSQIKQEAEESNFANPRYTPSSRPDNQLDERPKTNLIESVKQEILNDEGFRQRIISEVAPLLSSSDKESEDSGV